MLLVLYAIREPLAAALPSPHRDALLPLCWKTPHIPAWVTGVSLLIGAWTHIGLDLLTRESDWLLYQLPGIHDELAAIERQHVRVYRLLWYALSLVGLAWLTLTYLHFLKRTTGSRRIYSARNRSRYFLWGIVMVAPYVTVVPLVVSFQQDLPFFRAVRYFVLESMQVYLVAVTTLVVVIGFVVKARRKQSKRRRTGRRASRSEFDVNRP